eukprot:8553794-Ditylum_brightwellii.AAC.1
MSCIIGSPIIPTSSIEASFTLLLKEGRKDKDKKDNTMFSFDVLGGRLSNDNTLCLPSCWCHKGTQSLLRHWNCTACE